MDSSWQWIADQGQRGVDFSRQEVLWASRYDRGPKNLAYELPYGCLALSRASDEDESTSRW